MKPSAEDFIFLKCLLAKKDMEFKLNPFSFLKVICFIILEGAVLLSDIRFTEASGLE